MTYLANKYYSTMMCNTFIILGMNEEILAKANELQLACIIDNCDENCNKVNEFMEKHGLIYLDDVNYPMWTGALDDETEVLIDCDGKAYAYKVINHYEGRF